jgi:hypothetical protein
MIESWDDLLELLRHNDVPGTTLSEDTLRRLDEIERAARGPDGTQPHRSAREVTESRMQTLGVVLPVKKEDLAYGEVSFFWRDFFPYETPDCEGRVLAIVHDATRTVHIGGTPYPVVWNGNLPVVTMPREVLQAPPEANIPLWLRQVGCEIRFGKRAVGRVQYDHIPRSDELLERAMESLIQPQWRDLQHDWRLLAQRVEWVNGDGRLQTSWCVPVAPKTGAVPTDHFAVCTSQTAAQDGARRLLATALARQARAASEREMSERILRIIPAWEDLAGDIIAGLAVKAAASAHSPA